MSPKMKAVRYLGPGHIEITETARPAPRKDEALVEIRAVGICNQSDTRTYNNVRATYPLAPGDPGCEAAGVVIEVGDEMTDVKPGDRVVMTGRRMYAEFCTRRAHEMAPLPAGVDIVEAAALPTAGCLIAAARRAGSLGERSVIVTGLGAAGLFAVQWAKIEKADEIIGFDIRPDRFEAARRFGASTAAAANDRALLTRFREKPADVGIDCSGNPQAVSILYTTCSTIVAFGVLSEPVKLEVPASRLVTLFNGHLGDEERQAGLREAVRLFVEGKLLTKPIITDVMKLEDYGLAMQRVRRGEVTKVVLVP